MTEVAFYEDASFWVQFALAIVTGLLFLATYQVARRTRNLAEDTVEATRTADKHHQESLRPIVQWIGKAVLHEQYATEIEAGSPRRVRYYILNYRGQVENVGTGPALNIRAEFLIHGSLTFDEKNNQAMHLRGLAAGMSYDETFHQRLEEGRTAGATPNMSLAYRVTLTYENVFGKTCQTIHENPGGDGQTRTHHIPPDTTPRT